MSKISKEATERLENAYYSGVAAYANATGADAHKLVKSANDRRKRMESLRTSVLAARAA